MTSDVIELNYPIDIDRIRKEVDTIDYEDQICIQGLDAGIGSSLYRKRFSSY